MRKIYVYLLILLILSIIFCACSNDKNKPYNEIVEGKRVGDTIIYAIEKYHYDIGKYPDELNALIPLYLERIPISNYQHEFFYQKDSIDIYILMFKLDTLYNGACTYIKRLNSWDCSQAVDP
jgi:hypothetical protein